MPHDKDAKSQPTDLRIWLSNHGYASLYGDWLDYCISNNDSTTTLDMWLAANHPDVWKEYNGNGS